MKEKIPLQSSPMRLALSSPPRERERERKEGEREEEIKDPSENKDGMRP
jgi:hypothetical protein